MYGSVRHALIARATDFFALAIETRLDTRRLLSRIPFDCEWSTYEIVFTLRIYWLGISSTAKYIADPEPHASSHLVRYTPCVFIARRALPSLQSSTSVVICLLTHHAVRFARGQPEGKKTNVVEIRTKDLRLSGYTEWLYGVPLSYTTGRGYNFLSLRKTIERKYQMG